MLFHSYQLLVFFTFFDSLKADEFFEWIQCDYLKWEKKIRKSLCMQKKEIWNLNDNKRKVLFVILWVYAYHDEVKML